MMLHAVRFGPGENVKNRLHEQLGDARAGVIISAVGSFSKCVLRTADERLVELDDNVELLVMSGTLSTGEKVTSHVHVAVSKADGSVLGGHLVSATVYTTLELTIQKLREFEFRRESDPSTGFKELVVSRL